MHYKLSTGVNVSDGCLLCNILALSIVCVRAMSFGGGSYKREGAVLLHREIMASYK